GWSLEAGALVLANKGLCCIDEMDKMSKEDGWAMHEALEQQSVTISKANIQASLRCETTVLAAANPKFGRFDPYDTIANQINLAPTLINRFDLIFPIKDIPDAAKDERMAKFILSMHKNNVGKPDIETKMLRKYFAFARQNIFPKLTDVAIEELQEYYIKMRASAGSEGVKAVPISARQLEGLVRLSEASAKLRLSDKVLKRDAKKAIELLDYCMRQIAFDEKTGTFDIDRVATDMPASTRNKLILMKEIIQGLEAQVGKTIPVDDVMKAAAEKDITESEAEEILQKLKRAGDIFEPRKGFVSRI
ncbi:MAG TPA: ATP-binding protein, partial [Candidatus Nanoarchaeia archaeon]|nr:ATP-binding protein [Candidatus Nanoarchaeia archaeon]